MDDRHSYLQYDAEVESVVNDGPFADVPVETFYLPNGQPMRFAEPQPNSVMVVNADQKTLATVHPDGRVEYDPADLDEAARVFWDAVSTTAHCERVPAGTIDRALELLDDDHPAAAVLRGRPAPPGPRPGGRREPTVGELGLCGPDPGDDEARWTPDAAE